MRPAVANYVQQCKEVISREGAEAQRRFISRGGAKAQRSIFTRRRKGAEKYFHAEAQRRREVFSLEGAKAQRSFFHAKAQRRKEAGGFVSLLRLSCTISGAKPYFARPGTPGRSKLSELP